MSARKTEVLIVGAGPTGMALAIYLQQAGIDHVLVEKRETPQTTSRAAVIHAHTLEVLDRIGVVDGLLAQGIRRSSFVIRDRDSSLFRIGFDELKSEYNFLLMIPQENTEEIMRNRLAELGGEIHFGSEVAEISQREGGVSATITRGGKERTVNARYIVGADGMNSIVRKTAGISFEGETYDQSFMLADVTLEWRLGHNEVILFLSPDGLVVVAPLPGGFHRIVATIDEAPQEPKISDIQAVLDQRGPSGVRTRVTDFGWRSRFRVHHRLAATFAKPPFIIIGDAAHVHSPAGGQGMNCGLIDACILGNLLADIISGERAPSEVATLDDLRRPAAAEVLSMAGRMTGMATVRSPVLRTLRNIALRLADRLPPIKRRLSNGFSGIDRRHLSQLPLLK